MAILVTGGFGFIGLHTVRGLLDAGEEVVATQFRARREPDFIKDDLGRGLTRETLDITSSYALHDLMRKHRITGIIHLAVPGYGALSPSENYRSVMDGLLNVLSVAEAFRVPRVTLASSLAVYAGLDADRYFESDLLPVETPPAAATGAWKKSEEILGLHFADRAGIEVISARIGAIWGPLYHSMVNPPSRLVHRAVRNDERIRVADIVASHRRDYCYVKDAARALVMLHRSKSLGGRIYNVGSGRGTSHGEMAAAVNALVPDARLEIDETSAAPNPLRGVLDLTAIARDTGYAPQFDLERAMADYIDWVRANDA